MTNHYSINNTERATIDEHLTQMTKREGCWEKKRLSEKEGEEKVIERSEGVGGREVC
ncbi:6722_t:CDS:2 [Gigaspora margarita]|uniref:6722_t:CDS:1 n=1 Tax=Gigaspora margarita TaxID=4874 RepID=A0ABM8VXN3_GIGMA|nr:6722_t:CDS:2 [Gigaspora margarita]